MTQWLDMPQTKRYKDIVDEIYADLTVMLPLAKVEQFFDETIAELEAWLATNPDIEDVDPRPYSEYGKTFWRIWTTNQDYAHFVAYPYRLILNCVPGDGYDRAKKQFHRRVNQLLKPYK